MKTPLGVLHGRFQLLHKGHIVYIKTALDRCDHLLIGITNIDPELKKTPDPTDPGRTTPQNNPFTYYERYGMVQAAMEGMGIPRKRYDIIPFPIEEPQKIHNFTPKDAIFYVGIYDAWGRKKKDTLEGLGLTVEVLYDQPIEAKDLCATDLRRRIQTDQEWEEDVTPEVIFYLKEKNLLEKIRKRKP